MNSTLAAVPWRIRVSGVGIGVHGVGLGPAKAQAHRADELGEQVELGREVPVEEAFGDPGPVADVADAGGVVAAVGEQLDGDVDQLLLAFATLFGELSAASSRFSVAAVTPSQFSRSLTAGSSPMPGRNHADERQVRHRVDE